ncbi:MAG: hydrogenase expression/synthesis HypA [Labilithrix sp.]|nr:hydrogenase expression/synthesis HypA [Labilithrix sp.]
MHEVSLIQALFEEVDRALEPHASAVVNAIHVRVGEHAGVDPELFRTAYDAFRSVGRLANAELFVVSEPATWSCPLCLVTLVPGTPLTCGRCGTPARLTAGGEIFLDRIEAVISDV